MTTREGGSGGGQESGGCAAHGLVWDWWDQGPGRQAVHVGIDGSAPQLAPSFSPPAPEAAGSLLSTSHILEVPAPTTNLDGLSAGPLIPPVTHKAMGSTAANLNATSYDDDAMDTTPPSWAIIFRSPLAPHKAMGSTAANLSASSDNDDAMDTMPPSWAIIFWSPSVPLKACSRL